MRRRWRCAPCDAARGTARSSPGRRSPHHQPSGCTACALWGRAALPAPPSALPSARGALDTTSTAAHARAEPREDKVLCTAGPVTSPLVRSPKSAGPRHAHNTECSCMLTRPDGSAASVPTALWADTIAIQTLERKDGITTRPSWPSALVAHPPPPPTQHPARIQRRPPR